MKKMKIILTAFVLISAMWNFGCNPHQDAKDCIKNEGKSYNKPSDEKEKSLEKVEKASENAK